MNAKQSRRGPRGRRDAVRLAATAARILLHAVVRGVAGMLPRAGRVCRAHVRLGRAGARPSGRRTHSAQHSRRAFCRTGPAGGGRPRVGADRAAGASPRSSPSCAAPPAMRAEGRPCGAPRRARCGGAPDTRGSRRRGGRRVRGGSGDCGHRGRPAGPGERASGGPFRGGLSARCRGTRPGRRTRLHFCAGIPAEKHIMPRAGA